MTSLRQLDLKKVTDDERRMASIVVRKEEEKKKECNKAEAMKERRRDAILNAEKKWQLDYDPSQQCIDEKPVTFENGMSHYTEVETDTLRLYGPGALDGLDKNNTVANVAAISHIYFKFIPFDDIVTHFPKLRVRFPAVQGLTFAFSSVHSLKQLNALSTVRRLDFITISPEGNPVTNFTLWKYYLLYRLSHFNLRKINDVDVTMSDTVLAEQIFGEIGDITLQYFDVSRMLGLLPEVRRKQVITYCDSVEQKKHLTLKSSEERRKVIIAAEQKNRPTGTESLNVAAFTYTTHHRPKSGVRGTNAMFTQQFVDEAVTAAVSRHNKLVALEKIWPSVLKEAVRSAVHEFRNINSVVDKALSHVND